MIGETFTVRPLSGVAGVEVLGIDLRDELPPDVRTELRRLWRREALVLFRGQELNEPEQRRVGEIFGTVTERGMKRADGFDYISNVAADGTNPEGELAFHMDHPYYERPLTGLMLYAIEAPPHGAGGETKFANMARAFANLPANLKDRIHGRRILHCYPDLSKHVAIPGPDPRPDAPRYVHDLIFTHPETGQQVVFLSRRHVSHILDLSPAESMALIEELSAHMYGPENEMAHAWTPGDLVVWDNLVLQHARTNFDPKHRRHLRRLQIA